MTAPFFVYVMASHSKVLYVGVTNHLGRRVQEHKEGRSGFTQRYRVDRLVYCEQFERILDAIAREKQIKGWKRSKKIELIEAANPEWNDLSAEIWA